MPTQDQAQKMRQALQVVIKALGYAGIRLPEAMTAERFDQMTDVEAVDYGFRLFGHSLWRGVPHTFQIRVDDQTTNVTKQQLLRAMMIGLAPYQRQRGRP